MRPALFAICPIVLLMLSACGGGDPETPVLQPTPHLRVEAKIHNEEFALFLPDAQRPSSDAEILGAIDEYSQIVDPVAGFEGRDRYYGYGLNPVVYRAPPEAPLGLFTRLLELCGSQMVVKVRIELSVTSSGPPPVTIDLPRDESFIPSTRNWFTADTIRTEGRTWYEVGLAPSGRGKVQGSDHPSSGLLGHQFDASLYQSLRSKVVTTLLDIEVPEDSYIDTFSVRYSRTDANESWVDTFLLLDAGDQVSAARMGSGEEPLGLYAVASDGLSNTPAAPAGD